MPHTPIRIALRRMLLWGEPGGARHAHEEDRPCVLLPLLPFPLPLPLAPRGGDRDKVLAVPQAGKRCVER